MSATSRNAGAPTPPAESAGRGGAYRPHPDVWDEMPVTAETFETLPRPAGWKYERWGGRLRLEPDWRSETARYVGPLEGCATPPGVQIGRVSGRDVEDATDAADEAFADGPDFFCFPVNTRKNDLRRGIEDAVTLEPSWVRRAQRIARGRGGEVVGLLLVREVAGGVVLETVGVLPTWRRRGLAAAMLGQALAALPAGTEVRSGWLVANRESEAWHRRVGFEVVPTSVSAQSRVSVAAWDLGAGRGTKEDLARARAEVERLREAEEAGRAPDPFAFTRPVHRRPTA